MYEIAVYKGFVINNNNTRESSFKAVEVFRPPALSLALSV